MIADMTLAVAGITNWITIRCAAISVWIVETFSISGALGAEI